MTPDERYALLLARREPLKALILGFDWEERGT
jgi:hypothetical protein